MGELEPDDSRDVTNTTHHAPGGETPTGAREDEARRRAGQAPADTAPTDERAEGPAIGDRWHRAAQRADADTPDSGDREEPPLGK